MVIGTRLVGGVDLFRRVVALQNIADVSDYQSPTSVALAFLTSAGTFTLSQDLTGSAVQIDSTVPIGIGDSFTTLYNAKGASGTDLIVNGTTVTGSALSAINANDIRICAYRLSAATVEFFAAGIKQVLIFSSSRTAPQIAQLQAWAATL